MKMKRILVAYDFSETSKHALEMGCALAEFFPAHLEVLYVVSPSLPHLQNFGHLMVSLSNKLEQTVSLVMRRVVKPGASEPKWNSLIKEGSPYKVVSKHAEEINADLVIVGTHGYTGWEHAFLGSVAEKVLRRSPSPVLIHRHTENKGFKQILAPVDLSDASMRGLALAADLAKTFSAGLLVVHAVDLRAYVPISEFNLGVDVYGQIKTLQEEQENRFDQFIAQAKKSIPALGKIEWRAEAISGSPVKSLVEYADKHARDLIVMSSHEGKLGRLILGSTTESVSRYAHCSVLVIKG